LKNVIDPYVKKNMSIILGSRGEQSDTALYDENFIDGCDELVCTLEILPP
jgi:hypothetical protein